MTAFEEHWAGEALAAVAKLPEHVRDQVEMLVLGISRDPFGLGTERDESADPRNRVARTGQTAVFYQVSSVSEVIRIAKVTWAG